MADVIHNFPTREGNLGSQKSAEFWREDAPANRGGTDSLRHIGLHSFVPHMCRSYRPTELLSRQRTIFSSLHDSISRIDHGYVSHGVRFKFTGLG